MRYKAFISYSHGSTLKYAECLEQALKSYAKPFLARPIRIFRDEKHAVPGHDLPGQIRKALEASDFLILLGSQRAASSTWVEKELKYWCGDLGRTKHLILLLEDGQAVFHEDTIDWDNSPALPPILKTFLDSPPLYASLQWVQSEEEMKLSNPPYRTVVNGVSARLHKRDPNEMLGEENIQYRRTLRIVTTGLILMAIIALTAVLLYFRANSALNESRSRALSVEAIHTVMQPERLNKAIQAYELEPNQEAVLALRASLAEPIPTLVVAAHDDTVSYVGFSPSGREILSASQDGLTRLWATDTGQLLQTFHNRGRGQFSPDGNKMVICSKDGTVTLWARGSPWRRVAHLPMASAIRGECLIAFSPDGSRIAGGVTADVSLWSSESGAVIANLDGAFNSISFSESGQWLLGADMGTEIDGPWGAHVWNAFTGERVESLSHPEPVYDARFVPPEMRIVTAGQDRLLRVFNRGEDGHWTLAASFGGHSEAVKQVSVHPSGAQFATASFQDGIGIWNAETGGRTAGFGRTTGEIQFGMKGEQVYFIENHNMHRWRIGSRETETFSAHRGHTSSFGLNHQGTQLVTGGNDGSIAVWPLTRTREAPVVCLDDTRLAGLSADSGAGISRAGGFRFSHSGDTERVWAPVHLSRVLAWNDSIETVLWRGDGRANWLSVGDSEPVPIGSGPLPRNPWVSHDGQAAAIDTRSNILLWTSRTGVLDPVRCSSSRCQAAGWNGADRTHYLLSDQRKADLLTLSNQSLKHVGSYPPIRLSAFAHDGRSLAIQHRSSRLSMYSTTSTTPLWSIDSAPISSLVFSPDGLSVAFGFETGEVSVRVRLTGDELFRVRPHNSGVSQVRYDEASEHLATVSSERIVLLRPMSGEVEFDFEEEQARSLVFANGGRELAFLRRGCVWRRLLRGSDLLEAARAQMPRLLGTP